MNYQYMRTLLFIFVLCSYGFLSTQQTTADSSKKQYPVIIYISSQSSFVDPVNISVEIDFKNKILNKDFYYGDGHNFSKFEINLDKGIHQFIVKSKNGNAGLDVIFNVNKPLWLDISYWGSNHFQMNISEVGLVFM